MKPKWSNTMKLDPNRLRKLRNDRGLKQASLADDVGCDLRTIQRAEAGEKIKRHIALRISQVLDAPINRLSMPEEEDIPEKDKTAGCVELVSCTSGRQLLQQVRGCHFLLRVRFRSYRKAPPRHHAARGLS